MVKRLDALPLPTPAALRVTEAAAYCALSAGKFRSLVEEGTLPAPVSLGGIEVWLVVQLHEALAREAGITPEVFGEPEDEFLVAGNGP